MTRGSGIGGLSGWVRGWVDSRKGEENKTKIRKGRLRKVRAKCTSRVYGLSKCKMYRIRCCIRCCKWNKWTNLVVYRQVMVLGGRGGKGGGETRECE